MAYKLICIDVDGTLLNSKHKITKQTKAALQQAHQQGIHIVICTGRMYTDAEYFSNLVGVKSPVIASNGAFIKEKDNDKVIFKEVLGQELSLRLLEIFQKHNIAPYFCTPDKFYYGTILFKLFYIAAKLLGTRSNSIDLEYISSWQEWKKVVNAEGNNIVKCEIIYRNNASVENLQKELRCIEQVEVVNSAKHNIEINRKGVSKGKAVSMLAAMYNLKQEEILAIGDSENDISMIEYAGLGIAMGNALESVKQKADYITDSNDNEGVAKAISKFVLFDD
jgi:Cof subfamily protein (haloacid dehalogenase superfamily)